LTCIEGLLFNGVANYEIGVEVSSTYSYTSSFANRVAEDVRVGVRVGVLFGTDNRCNFRSAPRCERL
jgi:hypothetical protein